MTLTDTDGNATGEFSWFSRLYHSDNSTEVHYHCKPRKAGPEGPLPYDTNDYNDKEIWCMAGVMDPEADGKKGMADWCMAKMQAYYPTDKKPTLYKELRDGHRQNFANRGGKDNLDDNDKFWFDNDSGQQCVK